MYTIAMNIAIIVGSLRENSINKKLAQAIEQALGDTVEVRYISTDVPLFNEDSEEHIPAVVQEGADIVRWADGVVLVSPEYNRSFSGVIKNWLDWMSRESVGYPLDKKSGAIAGATPGRIGTAVMQQSLRPILAHMGMNIMPLPELFVQMGGEMDERALQAVQRFADALVAHVEE